MEIDVTLPRTILRTDARLRLVALLSLWGIGVAWLAPSAMAQVAAAAPSNEYVIGVEDVLRISVWGEPALALPVKVRPDGRISFPLVNDLKVEGMTAEQLRAELTTRLVKYIKEPNVTVIVEQINSFRVYVLGEVATQGMLNLQRPTRLLQAIAMAGGLTQFSKREVTVVREREGAEQRMKVDYRKLLSGEGGQEDIFLKPGDTILVN